MFEMCYAVPDDWWCEANENGENEERYIAHQMCTIFWDIFSDARIGGVRHNEADLQ